VVVKTPDESGSPVRNEEVLLEFLGTTEGEFEKVYGEIRRKLVHFFVYRGRSDFDELADRTIFEVLKDCRRVADSYVGDPLLWIYGVARNVLRESSKTPPATLPMPEPSPPEEKEARDECLRGCMEDRLEDADRAFIMQYYFGEKAEKIEHRKRLAVLLEKTENGLRIKAHRIRNKLRDCVSMCLTVKGFM
jgi:DNA-directed RNA polymerase specialized sigma24 family protein